jgi:hypothetical protein
MARREDLGAFPVSASRVLLSIADGEKHHENASRDDANHIVKAHHELLAVLECHNDVTISEMFAAP